MEGLSTLSLAQHVVVRMSPTMTMKISEVFGVLQTRNVGKQRKLMAQVLLRGG